MSYTKGPWRLEKLPEEGGDYIVYGNSGVCVALSVGGTIYETSNAHLISAAPDLLEALEQAVTSMQDSGYPNSHCAVRAARQAIAKAKGEQA